MNKVIQLTILCCLLTFASSAQLTPSSYNNLFEIEFKPTDKPLKPWLAGSLSFVVPGLGQVYCDEFERGLNFFTGYLGGLGVMGTGGLILLVQSYTNPNSLLGPIVFITGLTSAAGILVWSTVDAVQLAKSKNNYFKDSKASLHLQPTLLQHHQNLFTGLTLKLEF
jgi:hypothetical protein